MIFRKSKQGQLLDHVQLDIHLRSQNRVKFKATRRRYETCLKSLMSRGISLWNRLPKNVQKTTTKVKFKLGIRSILARTTLETYSIYKG